MSTNLEGLDLDFQTVIDTIDLFIEGHTNNSYNHEKVGNKASALRETDRAVVCTEIKLRLLLIAAGKPHQL